MKMNPLPILIKVIAHDPALAGFNPESLPESAKARIMNTLCDLESILDEVDLELLRDWCGTPVVVFSTSEGECTYSVFEDRSLYYRSSGDSEVWSFASDFGSRIISDYDSTRPEDRDIDKMDSELLTYLGTYHSDFVEQWKADRAAAEKNG